LQKKQLHQKKITLTQRVEQYICHHTLLQGNEKIVVGVSGGVDSLALLHILHELDLDLHLIAVYIDHGLRLEEAEAEKKTVKKYCQHLQIPFISESVNVPDYVTKNKCSPEEGARILRYGTLEKVRCDSGASLIAVAHTADDQVEEFFIRLIRGSSLRGLSGMQPRRDLIIRPLLDEAKETLLNYLTVKGVSFCQDSSNFDRKFMRNRVRFDLLPRIKKEFNPSIRHTILQNMDILTHDDNCLNEICNSAFKECVGCHLSVDSETTFSQLLLFPASLSKYHHAIQRRVIEKCFWQMKIKPGYRQIQAVLHFTQTTDSGHELHLADGVRVEKSVNQILISRPLEKGRLRGSVLMRTFRAFHIPSPGTYRIEELGKTLKISVSTRVTAPGTRKSVVFLDLRSVNFPLYLRPPKPGERFRPYNSPGRKKIVRYLSDKKIDRNNRSSYPVLLSNNRIIALPGLQIAHDVRITESTEKILIIEMVNEKLES